MQAEDALKLNQSMLDASTGPMEVLDACREAMEIIGKRFGWEKALSLS